MNIRVNPDTEAWLKAEVDAGHFPSIAEAIDALVMAHQAAWHDVSEDDHMWAKPLIEEALASIDRGEGSNLQAVEQRLRDRIRNRG